MGSHHIPVTGGAFGTRPAAPGTNSLVGPALSSSGTGYPMKGPRLGTNPAIDSEEAKVELPGLLKRLRLSKGARRQRAEKWPQGCLSGFPPARIPLMISIAVSRASLAVSSRLRTY
jgi:hypothetical protein